MYASGPAESPGPPWLAPSGSASEACDDDGGSLSKIGLQFIHTDEKMEYEKISYRIRMLLTIQGYHSA